MIVRLPLHRLSHPVRFIPRHRTPVPRQRVLIKRPTILNSSSGGGEDSGSGQGESSWNWNPFTGDKSKQDAAEKALREAFGERQDVLAQFDRDDDDGGSGGGDGDDGWNWSWDDWRNGFSNVLGMFFRWIQGLGKSIGAIIIFALGLSIMGIIPTAVGALMTFLKVLLRIEKADDVYGRRKVQPAGRQRSVLFSDDEEEETPASK